jgi:putative DNA primase/helicase
MTDLGNAERLVAQHGSDLRYVPGMGWLVWSGRYWRRDDDGEVMRRAKLSARSILAEAQHAEDADHRKRILKWAITSETEPRLRAAVSLAESEQPVIARAEELDAHPYKLNVENGTLNLATGKLYPHDRADLITKLAPVEFDADVTSEQWERVILRACGGDTELAAFLQRSAGYTATGDTGEEVLLFLHGPGATAKTTFIEAIKATLGDYATTADFDAFLRRHGDAGVRSDIARLVGARLVVSVEVDDGKHLAEGLLKQLTGGDTVAARFMYRDFFEFRPAFKLWLVANARPRVNADDEAIWRRIVQIPFTQVIPEHERDPNLKRKLQTDTHIRSAILAWLVQGCLDWQNQGLAVPERVRTYTAEYRAENDTLAEFISEECVVGSEHWCLAGHLRGRYEGWCDGAGEKAVTVRTWGEKLKARGCSKDRLGQGKRERIWRGIALRGTEP